MTSNQHSQTRFSTISIITVDSWVLTANATLACEMAVVMVVAPHQYRPAAVLVAEAVSVAEAV
jgi:hypothetical protein